VLNTPAKRFKTLGFEVATAKDGLEGWRLVIRNRIDLVLTDINRDKCVLFS
jgi:YesN/AraC family two-component response regulator